MPHPLQLVLFDIGGILETTVPTDWRSRWARRLGLDVPTLQARLRPTWIAGSIGTITEAEADRAVSDALGLSDEDRDELMNDVWIEYLGGPNQPLIDWFSAARARVRTGILSNSFVGAREREHAAYGFEDLVEHIVYSHEVGCQKPDPRIYEVTCQAFDLAPDAIVLLDDVTENVAAARAFGMHAVHFRDNDQAIAELEAFLA